MMRCLIADRPRQRSNVQLGLSHHSQISHSSMHPIIPPPPYSLTACLKFSAPRVHSSFSKLNILLGKLGSMFVPVLDMLPNIEDISSLIPGDYWTKTFFHLPVAPIIQNGLLTTRLKDMHRVTDQLKTNIRRMERGLPSIVGEVEGSSDKRAAK